MFERGTFLLTQQFPQCAEIASCLQIPHRKALAQQGGIDVLPRDPSPFPESAKQERNPTLGERTTRLREEEVILAGTSPLHTFCRHQTVFIYPDTRAGGAVPRAPA